MDKDYIGEYDIAPGDYIALGFLTHNDSYDKMLRPEDGHLRFDGKDIYFIFKDGTERQSHTMNHAIQVWLEDGHIKRREKE